MASATKKINNLACGIREYERQGWEECTLTEKARVLAYAGFKAGISTPFVVVKRTSNIVVRCMNVIREEVEGVVTDIGGLYQEGKLVKIRQFHPEVLDTVLAEMEGASKAELLTFFQVLDQGALEQLLRHAENGKGINVSVNLGDPMQMVPNAVKS
jgi:hypothetical protein